MKNFFLVFAAAASMHAAAFMVAFDHSFNIKNIDLAFKLMDLYLISAAVLFCAAAAYAIYKYVVKGCY